MPRPQIVHKMNKSNNNKMVCHHVPVVIAVIDPTNTLRCVNFCHNCRQVTSWQIRGEDRLRTYKFECAKPIEFSQDIIEEYK